MGEGKKRPRRSQRDEYEDERATSGKHSEGYDSAKVHQHEVNRTGKETDQVIEAAGGKGTPQQRQEWER